MEVSRRYFLTLALKGITASAIGAVALVEKNKVSINIDKEAPKHKIGMSFDLMATPVIKINNIGEKING